MKILIVGLISLLVAACSDVVPNQALSSPGVVKAGEQATPIGRITYLIPHGGLDSSCAEGCDDYPPITACSFIPATSIAIVESMSPGVQLRKERECTRESGLYQPFTFRKKIRVLAVAAGDEQREELDVFFVYNEYCESLASHDPSRSYLARIHKVGDYVLISGCMEISINSSESTSAEVTSGEGIQVDLPSSFEDLSQQLMITLSGGNPECSEEYGRVSGYNNNIEKYKEYLSCPDAEYTPGELTEGGGETFDDGAGESDLDMQE